MTLFWHFLKNEGVVFGKLPQNEGVFCKNDPFLNFSKNEGVVFGKWPQNEGVFWNFKLDEYIFRSSPQPRPRDFTFSREFLKTILGNEDWQQKNISYIFLLSVGCMKIALCIGNTEAFIFEHVSNTRNIHGKKNKQFLISHSPPSTKL